MGAIYLPLAQIKCSCSEERGRKTGGEKKSLCGGFAWNLQNQLFTYSYFLILIQLSNADLDASLCVYPHILQIPPVSLKIPHTNFDLSFSPGLLCFAALSAQNVVESFWLSSFCLFLLSFVKAMSVSHYRLKPALLAVFKNWRWKIGIVTLCVVIFFVIFIF